MSRETVDDKNPFVHRIQRMRNEVDVFNKGRVNSYGPISHALENLPGFSHSPSEWSEDHLCRFQVVISDEQPDEALFPHEYAVLDNDKTLKAITEDGFFLPTNEDLMAGAFSARLYSGFFMDLLQLMAEGQDTKKTEISYPVLESTATSSRHKPKTAIAKTLAHTKVLHPAPSTVQLLSHSLLHNCLKYVASMEHLSFPSLPFWCPWYVFYLVFLISLVRTLSRFPLMQQAQTFSVIMTELCIPGSDVPRNG